MKVAVTGATGFIGRHVVAELDRLGHAITLLVRPGRSMPEHLRSHPRLAVDFAAPPAGLHELAGRPDRLIHLAWGGLPNYRALHHMKHELPLQFRFLEAMVDSGLSHVLITGTCLEYGHRSGPLSEDGPAEPDCAYALAKDTLRRQLGLLRESKPFALTWARLFYTFGEGQAEGALWPSLTRAASRGEASFPMSGGEQLRDYLPVPEVARLLVALAISECDAGVVNVCSGHPISVRRLVEGWLADNEWRIALDLGARPYATYEPMAFWGDRRKLDACLAAHLTDSRRTQ